MWRRLYRQRTLWPAVITLLLAGIFAILAGVTLVKLAALIVPLCFAILINITLTPAVRRLVKWHVPQALAAALVMVGLLVPLGGVSYAISEPASEWAKQVPGMLEQVNQRIAPVLGPLRKLRAASAQVESLTSFDETPEQQVEGDNKKPVQVQLRDPSLAKQALEETPQVLVSVLITIVMSYFLLCSREPFFVKLLAAFNPQGGRFRALRIARDVRHDTAYYLRTIALINLGLGLASSLVLEILGVPNPLLFGMMTGLLNFAPYVGPAMALAAVSMVSLMTFDSLSYVLLAPGGILLLEIVESQLVTPSLLGRNLRINPVLVFCSIVFWGWLWGVSGALLAVPILTIAKVLNRHLRPAKWLAQEDQAQLPPLIPRQGQGRFSRRPRW